MLADAPQLIPTVISALLAILTFSGIHKYLIEPWMLAREKRKKYATALWIACNELNLHLTTIKYLLDKRDATTVEALKKVPNNDFNGDASWFTKWGYYTTITAYKIALVSAWLRIYQQDLLFSTYRNSRVFMANIYRKADKTKIAFSKNTRLWYYYFDAIGDRIVDKSDNSLIPISFSQFCEKYATDVQFRLFYEQLHMFIWFIADGKYPNTINEVNNSLAELMKFLESENLLAGFEVKRSDIEPSELSNQP